MPDPHKRPQAEAKRLRKSVKRRRQYVDSLRGTVAAIGADPEAAEAQRIFADLLADLADRELGAARDEEAEAKRLEGRREPADSYPHNHPEMIRRGKQAMTAMAGRFSTDRIAHLIAHLGMSNDVQWPSGNEAMTAIEERLGLTGTVNPAGMPRMLMGRRIALAETTAFGAPRFE